MIAILKALIRIAKNLERIRYILEIAYEEEIKLHELYKEYSKSNSKVKDSDREFNTISRPTHNEYGEVIEYNDD